MTDNFFSIPGYNPLRFTPQMPGLAQTTQGINNPMPNYIDPNQKQGQGVSPYMMTPSWQFGLNYNQIAFSSAVQGIGAFMRSNNQRKDFAAYNRAQQNPLSQLPENPNTTDQALYGMKQYKSGGLTSDKAKEMLRDGTAQGRPLTDNQKKYFGYVAGGGNPKMAEGGTPNFDNFDDFNEDDFQDLKDELDKYFNEKDTGASEPEQKEEQKPDQEELEDEATDQQDNDEPRNRGAMDFLLSQQDNNDEEDKDEVPEEQSDADIMNQLAGKKEIPHPSVYATKPTDNVEAFKKGIAQVENAGYNEGNKNSSAFGKYQFTAPTREAVREQFFKDISKNDFESAYKSDPQFQERVMDVYGSHLLQKYSDPHQAATAFYLGEGKSNMYNQRDYNPGNGNVSVGKYLDTFDKGYNKKQGGHIMNAPMSMSLPFDKPYNFKMEEGGDPTKSNQPQQSNQNPPIYTNNPSDPRLKAYNDSLNFYKWTHNPDGSPDLNTKSNMQEYPVMGSRTRFLRFKDYKQGVSEEPSHDMMFTNDNVYHPVYDKPIQPYMYKKPEYIPPMAKRSQVQGPQSLTPNRGQIGIPTGGPGPLAGGPTNFSFTGRNDQGQQDTRYFSDLDTWKAATDQMGYRWRNETNNGKEAHASGYQFREGGEYNLTNLQIAQLKKMGYQIEILK